MSSLQGALLLSDATMPVNFCKAGVDTARAMAKYLGENVYLVDEVHEELKRLAEGMPQLRAFLEDWPQRETFRLSTELREEVTGIVTVRRIAGAHHREDRGEAATVVYAAHRRDTEGQEFTILTDDQWGKQFSRDRRIRYHDTPHVIVAMVRDGHLAYQDGQRVWRCCFSDIGKLKLYRQRIEKDCPERLPGAR